MWIKRIVSGTVVLSVLLSASFALAQPKGKEKEKNNDQAMDFKDDPLEAGGLGPNEIGLKIRSGPVRSTLIKPRMSFVPQMLKSVENL